jgi:hypothetical protein
MIFSYEINGLRLQTGDLICTTDGGGEDIKGQFWRLIGKLIPGDVDHIVVYVGPEGRCVEAGAKGKVITFEVLDQAWNAEKMKPQRGPFIDTLYGVAYPLEGKGFDESKSTSLREKIAGYCLKQAELKRPYNINFLNSSTQDAFYCSQLAYRAYLEQGIDLNTGIGIPDILGTESIIFPQEIWNSCVHRQAVRKPNV